MVALLRILIVGSVIGLAIMIWFMPDTLIEFIDPHADQALAWYEERFGS